MGGHLRIASVCEPTRMQAVAALGRTDADLVEVRLDALWPTPPEEQAATGDLIALVDAAPSSLLGTLRPLRQGGAFDGPETVRVGLLMAAARAGFAAVDIEDDHQDVARVASTLAKEARVVVSDHRFPAAPDRETGLRHLQSMQDMHALIDKIAFPCGSFADGLRALELAHAHAHRNGRPAVCPLGGGAMLRALLPLAGNHATYGHAGTPAVPGQPALADIEATWQHWGIGPDDLPVPADAGWYAVVGHPVGHSLSPRIHNAALRAHGSDARFGALDVPDSIGAMRLLCTVAPRLGLRGLSVTAPLKGHAHAVTAPDATAKAVGAANCVRFTPSGPESTNTDATAMARILVDAAPRDLVVLGAGGAARAALWAAAKHGVRATFTSRDAQRAATVAAATGAKWVPWGERETLRAQAWIQATPLGRKGDALAASPAMLEGARLAVEMVYADGETPFLRDAAALGAHTVSGHRMLIEQALDAFAFWTGKPADRTAMEGAL